MSDQDPLASRLVAFREATVAGTVPPGVAAVRRTVARRDAVRTVAAGVVAAALAIAFVLAGATRGPEPVLPPPVVPTVAPSPAAASSAADTPPTSAPPPTTASSDQIAYACAYAKTGGPYIHGDPMMVDAADYWQRCPDARLRIYVVLYEWDVGQQRYTQTRLSYIYLTRANPTAPQPIADLDPIASVCGYAFLVVGSDGDPPTVLPQDAANTVDFFYWYRHGLGGPIAQIWNTTPDYRQLPVCQPTPGSTP
jgi:hypothetical protein